MTSPKSKSISKVSKPGAIGGSGNIQRARSGRGVSAWVGRIIVGIVVCLLLLLGWGLFNQQRTETATAVVRSNFGDIDDVSSVNGFGVFQQVLEAKGCDIHSTSILAPQLDQNDVLIWFHDSINLPQEEAFERVDQWLEGRNRTVIFVGNDHNAKVEFLESVYRNSELKDQQWARVVSRMEKSREGRYQRRYEVSNQSPYRRFYEGQSCSWFSVVSAPSGFVGHWEIDGAEVPTGEVNENQLPSLRVRNYFQPGRKSDVLASCNNGSSSLPIVTKSSFRRGGGKIILVSSASFFSNYGIVIPENRPLIDLLLDEIPDYSQIQVLESGPQDVPLSSTPEDRLVKTWTWMKHGLFPIAVLHVLLFAVIFCFARYPVFGRPKELHFEPRNDFGLHLEEVGRLLRSSKKESFAREKIQHYFDVVKRSLIGRGPSSRQ